MFSTLNTSNIQSSTVQRPRIPIFSGDQKGETTFEVWKFEVKCIIREGNYLDVVILQSICNSLKGPARNLLLTLSENATPLQILDKLEGVFGNVYSSEALLQMFYMEKQQSNQTVADYGMKLESILQSAIEKGHISSSSRDEMLMSKFWFGLKDQLLRNAYQHIYDTVKDFDTLRREIRAIELNLSNSSANNAINTPTVQQNSISVESQKLTEVLKKLVAFNKRIDSVETELRELKVKDDSKQSSSVRGSYNQGFNRGNPRRRWNGHRGQYGQGQNRGQYGQGQNRNQSQYGQGQGQNLNR